MLRPNDGRERRIPDLNGLRLAAPEPAALGRARGEQLGYAIEVDLVADIVEAIDDRRPGDARLTESDASLLTPVRPLRPSRRGA
ncbi:MAG TPA: hypothetical protein VFJ96_10790 [Gemmatimonadaceae bacterium]|nr:hypothetical protein [Gemmatimonadaceae bacterium]